MNNKERKKFWDTLCSLNGENIQEESDKLWKTIKYPGYLYRYRPINIYTIDALQTNKLFFSKPYYYDDPFDTNITIDMNDVQNRANTMFNIPNISEIFKQMCDSLKIDDNSKMKGLSIFESNTKEQMVQGLKEEIQKLTDYLQSDLKQNIWSVCFSESGLNETMWLKYADQYKGFCLMYSLKDDSKLLCGKKDKCSNCIMNIDGMTSLYPMYYSNVKYDATDYAQIRWFEYICNSRLPKEISYYLLKNIKQNPWEHTKISLIKSKCHEYDKEWRILCNQLTDQKIMREWIPYGIILGLRTEESDKKLLIRSAKLAGIDNIYELYINEKYKLAKRKLKV